MLKLLTLLLFLLGGAYYIGRRHTNRRHASMQPTLIQHPPLPPQRRFLLYGVAGALLLLISWFFYAQWRDEFQVVQIRVIHVQSGQTLTYQARRGKIHHRTFTTVDGRLVTLADVERMEITEE